MQQEINSLLKGLQKIKESKSYGLSSQDVQIINDVELQLKEISSIVNNKKPDLDTIVQIAQLMAILLEMMK